MHNGKQQRRTKRNYIKNWIPTFMKESIAQGLRQGVGRQNWNPNQMFPAMKAGDNVRARAPRCRNFVFTEDFCEEVKISYKMIKINGTYSTDKTNYPKRNY
ncbi:hypothetical protein RF11_15194 [Thelohanellus kitauei]|uniref:Uncharacterized protein n=1 Tax=Thelohanellus kitauei TaxID=669202 RepID=A0A0C2N8P5_THEKT|nr:hypothetical protein RF11_15194 [Thelohanellus kitauei]